MRQLLAISLVLIFSSCNNEQAEEQKTKQSEKSTPEIVEYTPCECYENISALMERANTGEDITEEMAVVDASCQALRERIGDEVYMKEVKLCEISAKGIDTVVTTELTACDCYNQILELMERGQSENVEDKLAEVTEECAILEEMIGPEAYAAALEKCK